MSENFRKRDRLIILHRNLYQLEEREDKISRESREELFHLLRKSRFQDLSDGEELFINELCLKNRPEEYEKIILEAEKRGIEIITWYDEEYPFTLFKDPPPVIYVKGSLPERLFNPYIAFVGARKATAYGRESTRELIAGLKKFGVTIVSGLAYGIDAYAHEAAIKNGLSTVAVMGCGIDKIYPAANRELADGVALNGAIISEFPWGTPPLKHNFPLRNRVISGLSRAVVVVEAIIRSGSLITARWAADQGREVFAVPGNIGRAMSSGTNALIKDGAHLVESGEEIAQVLGLEESATSEIKKSSGQDDGYNDIKLALTQFLRSGGNNLEKLIEETGLSVQELLPLITEAELSKK